MNKKRKNIITSLLLLLLLVGVVSAGVPTYTYLSDGVTWFNDKVGFGTDSPTAEVEIVNADTTTSLFINQDGNGIALNIDSEATTSSVIRIDADTLTTGHGLYVGHEGAMFTSPEGLFRARLGNPANTGYVAKIEQRSTTSGSGMLLINDGTGNALNIDQNSVTTGIALDIDSEVTNDKSFRVEAQLTGNNQVAYIRNNGNQSGASAGVLYLVQENSASSAEVLNVRNDGTGASIELSSNGAGIQIKSPDGTVYCLTIANGGTTNVAAGACTK